MKYIQFPVSFLLTVSAIASTAPLTRWASGDSRVTIAGQPLTLKGYATDTDGNLSLMSFYVSGPGLPNPNGWNPVGTAPASGATATVTKTWTPPQGGTYSVHIRAMDADGLWDSNASVVGTFHVSAVNQAPHTDWAAGTDPFAGQPSTLTARVTDPDGNLQAIDFYLSGPGLPNPGGWNYVKTVQVPNSGKCATITTQWTPPEAGTYAVHIRAVDTAGVWDPNASVVAYFESRPATAAYRFKILVDVNQWGGADGVDRPGEINPNPAQLAELTADGVASSTYNSPSSVNWPTLLTNLNASQWTITEEEYFRGPIEWNRTSGFLGRAPNASFIYDERVRRPDNRDFLDTILAADEIVSANTSRGSSNRVVVLSRSYIGGGIFPDMPDSGYESIRTFGSYRYPVPVGELAGSITVELRGYYVDMALAMAECAGVVFEGTASNAPLGQSINEGITRALAQGKKAYVLLAPRNPATYQNDVQGAMSYFASRPDLLNSPNLHFILCIYHRQSTMVGFLTGDNGASTNSARAAVQYLKIFRQRS